MNNPAHNPAARQIALEAGELLRVFHNDGQLSREEQIQLRGLLNALNDQEIAGFAAKIDSILGVKQVGLARSPNIRDPRVQQIMTCLTEVRGKISVLTASLISPVPPGPPALPIPPTVDPRRASPPPQHPPPPAPPQPPIFYVSSAFPEAMPIPQGLDASQAPHGLSTSDNIFTSIGEHAPHPANPEDLRSLIPQENDEEPMRSITGPRATMDIVAPKPSNTSLANAPSMYRALHNAAREILAEKSQEAKKVAKRALLGLLKGKDVQERTELFQYLNTKSDHSKEDELIVDSYVEVLGQQDMAIPAKFANLIQKSKLGYLGYLNAPALKEQGLELIEFIARGGMGAVYKARKESIDKIVAVKIVEKWDPNKDHRLEARYGALFDPQNPVVSVTDAGMVNNFPFLVMALLQGATDLDHLPPDLTIEQRLEICHQMAKAIRVLHTKIIHRDIKPGNFLIIWEDGKPKVFAADLGLAKGLEEEDKGGTILGTAHFMSTEQAWGNPTTEKSDVTSLAYAMLVVLIDHLPLPPEIVRDSFKVIQHIRQQNGMSITPRDPRFFKEDPDSGEPDYDEPKIPPELALVICKMTHADPDKRPDLDEVIAAFERYFYEQSPEVQEAKLQRTISTRSKATAALSGVMLAAALVGGGAYVLNRRSDAHNTYGALRAKALKDLKTATDDPKATPEALKNLIDALRRVDDEDEPGNPGYKPALAKYEPDPKQGEPGDEEMEGGVKAATEKEERMTTADRLIAEGDVLLVQKPANFDGAREKYRKAGTTSPERKTAVEKSLEGVDRGECKWNYEQGLRAYHRGELEVATAAFTNVKKIQLAGLSKVEITSISTLSGCLQNWRNLQVVLNTEIQGLLSRDLENFVRKLLSQANDGDTRAFSQVIILRGKLLELVGARTEAGSSREDLRKEFQQSGEMTRLGKLVLDITICIARAPIEALMRGETLFYNPGDLRESQYSTMGLIAGYQEKLESALKEGGALDEDILKLIEMLDFLYRSTGSYGRLAPLSDDPNTDPNTTTPIDDYLCTIFSAVLFRVWAISSEKTIDRLINEASGKFSNFIVGKMREIPR